MHDYLTGRTINPKERVLICKGRVYACESFISFDTSRLEGYPPEIYYDKDENFLGKMYDPGIYILPDIEDVLISYQNQIYSNHDLEDLRKLLIKRREEFYEGL